MDSELDRVHLGGCDLPRPAATTLDASELGPTHAQGQGPPSRRVQPSNLTGLRRGGEWGLDVPVRRRTRCGGGGPTAAQWMSRRTPLQVDTTCQRSCPVLPPSVYVASSDRTATLRGRNSNRSHIAEAVSEPPTSGAFGGTPRCDEGPLHADRTDRSAWDEMGFSSAARRARLGVHRVSAVGPAWNASRGA